MQLSATGKLLKKNFGITDFQAVIHKLEKEPEDTFKNDLFVEKDFFIGKIRSYHKSIEEMYDAYSMALDMMKPGSFGESMARNEIGYLRIAYAKERKLFVHHLSYFYKRK